MKNNKCPPPSPYAPRDYLRAKPRSPPVWPLPKPSGPVLLPSGPFPQGDAERSTPLNQNLMASFPQKTPASSRRAAFVMV